MRKEVTVLKNAQAKKLKNLEQRQAAYDKLPTDVQRKQKRPGSRKK